MPSPLDKLRTRLTPYWARAYASVGPHLDLTVAAPILIFGHQKTGSSAIAGLLAARTGRSVAPNVHEAWRVEHALATGALPADVFIQRQRYYFRHALVKENSLTLAADALLAVLPRARSVFTIRHPLDTIRSILDRLGWPTEPQPRTTLPPIPAAWRSILDVRPWGIETTDAFTALAERWRLAAEIALEDRPHAVRIRYEDFLADKIGAIDQLAHQLGLNPAEPIEALLDHAFQPHGRRRDFPIESLFSAEIQAQVQQICGPAMKAFGYAPIAV